MKHGMQRFQRREWTLTALRFGVPGMKEQQGGGLSNGGGAVFAWAGGALWKPDSESALACTLQSFYSLLFTSFFIICVKILLYSPMQHPLERDQGSYAY